MFATASHKAFALRGYVDPLTNAHLPYRVPRLGVNAELTQYQGQELNAQLEAMRTAHVTWVRQFFPWDLIEPQPGVYAWDVWDRIVSAVSRYPDLRLVAVLVNTPTWARPPNKLESTTPPADAETFARFAGAVAARYSTAIDHYQVWDEPNLTAGWGGELPRPTQYLDLLRSAYQAVHAADPDAVVLAAALAPTVETGPSNISDLIFLRDLYLHGARDYMDAVAAKPYGFNTSPDDRRVDAQVLNFSRLIALREEMVRHGDTQKALWAASWGWNSLPADWLGTPSIWGAVSSDERTAFTLAALDRAHREWPWLGGMILTHWQPDVPSDDPFWGFALVDKDGEATPLLQALRQRSPEKTAENGLFFAANPYARYSGVWVFGPLGADTGWINDSSLTFDFSGAGVALLLREDNYVAYLYPSIDGQQPNALPRDPAGNAYIVLTSDSRRPEINLVTVARDLSLGSHTLQVIADDLVLDDAVNRWPIVGFAVSDGNLAEPYDRQLTVAFVSALVSFAALGTAAARVDWTPLRAATTRAMRALGEVGQLIVSAVTSLALLLGMMLTWGNSTPALFRSESVQLGLAILSAGLIYVEPGLLLTLGSLALLFVVVYHCACYGLALVLFWSPFFLFPVQLYRFAFPIAELILLVTAAAWGLRVLVSWGSWRQTTITHLPPSSVKALMPKLVVLDWAVLAWILVGVVSLIWTHYLPQAITELRVMMVEPAVFYLIMRTSSLSRRGLVRLADALLLAGLVVSLVSLGLFAQNEAVITAEEGARRLAGVYGSPNNLALFLGRCVPFGLAFALLAPQRSRRALAALSLLPIFFVIMLTQSAGAILLGVPASVVAVILLTFGRRAVPALVGALFTAALAFCALLQLPRFARLLDFTSGTNFARVRVWQSSLNVIRDNPITGLGLDQFLYAFRGRYIMPDAWQEPDLSHPHNILLDFWIRLGLAGLAVLIWLQLAFWRAAWRAYRYWCSSDQLCFALIVGAMGCMVNLLAHGMVDNSVYVNDLAIVFAFILGLAASLSNTRAIDAVYQKVV
ncbi:MAG: O-antigen ligase family protein [Aggregatilineales bacterium]